MGHLSTGRRRAICGPAAGAEAIPRRRRRSAGQASLAGLATLVLVAIQPACGEDLQNIPVLLDDGSQLAQALDYSCAVSSATGYTSGTPFAIELVTVQGQPVEIHTADALLTMLAAAARDGVHLGINSAFRSNEEQAYLYACYVHCNCNDCNPAAAPGYSNHQSGHAIDFDMSGSAYNWIFERAPSFGWSNAEGASVGEDWHWTWWGGGQVDAYCTDQPPRGYLDSVTCSAVSGWAQDPDDPALAIQVHLYLGGPAGSGARGVSIRADLHRDDLCSAIGSCAHGYRLPAPLSLFDDQARPVYAYGISSSGQNNALLHNSPRELRCAAEVPDGVRRHVINMNSYNAWQLDGFFDRLPLPADVVLDMPAGEDLPALPRLVKADDGSPEVWVVDGNHRRHVPSPAAMDAWRFDWGAIEVIPVDALHALELGPTWRPRPVQVAADGAIYLVDDALEDPEPPVDGDAGSADDASAAGDAGLADRAAEGSDATTPPTDAAEQGDATDLDDASQGAADDAGRAATARDDDAGETPDPPEALGCNQRQGSTGLGSVLGLLAGACAWRARVRRRTPQGPRGGGAPTCSG